MTFGVQEINVGKQEWFFFFTSLFQSHLFIATFLLCRNTLFLSVLCSALSATEMQGEL